MYRITIGRIEQGHATFIGVDLDVPSDVAPHVVLDHVRFATRAVIDKSAADPSAVYTIDLHRLFGDDLPLRSIRRYTLQAGKMTTCDSSRHDSLKAMGLYYTVGASD